MGLRKYGLGFSRVTVNALYFLSHLHPAKKPSFPQACILPITTTSMSAECVVCDFQGCWKGVLLIKRF